MLPLQSDQRSANAIQSAPNEQLSLEETLRILDVARQLRDQRESAEEMFRRDDQRTHLRDKLMRTARLSGDRVSEEEIDVAIDRYFDALHRYRDPALSISMILAHLWVWRNRILGGVALAAICAGLWSFFS